MYACTYTCVAFQWLPENGSAHQQLLFKQEVVLNLISACPCIQLYCLSVLCIYSTYIHTVHHGTINWYCSLGLLSFRHAYRDSKLWHYKRSIVWVHVSQHNSICFKIAKRVPFANSVTQIYICKGCPAVTFCCYQNGRHSSRLPLNSKLHGFSTSQGAHASWMRLHEGRGWFT